MTFIYVLSKPFLSFNLFFSFRDKTPWTHAFCRNMTYRKERGQKLGDRGRTHKNTLPTNPAHHLSGHFPNSPVLTNHARYSGENLFPFVSGRGLTANTQGTFILTLSTFLWTGLQDHGSSPLRQEQVFVLHSAAEERDHEQNCKIHHK